MSKSHTRLDLVRWRKLTEQIKERDAHQCNSCGSINDLTVDHITPLSKATSEEQFEDIAYDPNNLITLCRKCNGRKQARTLERSNWFDRKWLSKL